MMYKKVLLLPILILFILSTSGFDLLSSASGSIDKQSSTKSSQENDSEQNENIDPKAVEILQTSLEYFANIKRFSAQAQSSLEDLLETGHKVIYEFAGKVVVKRPSHLRNERYGEKLHQIFYYDGKTLTLYDPDKEVYATEPAPGTIDNMFIVARDSFGVSVPISDLVYSNSFELLYQDVDYAEVIGKEMIGKIQCDHLLFSRTDVDFEVWFADSGPPLPYKYVVTDKTTPKLLSFITTIYDWNLKPEIPDNYFNFIPPKGTQKIIFLKPNDDN